MTKGITQRLSDKSDFCFVEKTTCSNSDFIYMGIISDFIALFHFSLGQRDRQGYVTMWVNVYIAMQFEHFKRLGAFSKTV